MSYCVHCGVQLADSEKDCPLCFTPVSDPHRAVNSKSIPSFPERLDKPNKINIRFLTLLAALLLLFPLMVVIILDILSNRNLTWSLYVLGAEACIWSFIIFPLNCPKLSPYLHISVCSAVSLGYILLIHTVSHSRGWFIQLALPLVLMAFAFCCLVTLIYRNKRINRITKSGFTAILLSVLLVGIDMTVVKFTTDLLHPSWAWYVSVPICVFGSVIVVASRSVRISEWIRRKLFI